MLLMRLSFRFVSHLNGKGLRSMEHQNSLNADKDRKEVVEVKIGYTRSAPSKLLSCCHTFIASRIRTLLTLCERAPETAVRLFILSIICATICAQSALAENSISPNTVVLLLSQTVHQTNSTVLDDQVKKWGKSTLRIKFLSVNSTEVIENAFNAFQGRLAEAKIDLRIQKEEDIDLADILVFFDQNASDILVKHNLQVFGLMSTKEIQADEQSTGVITQILNNDTSDCLGFDSTIEKYQKIKSLIFVGSNGTPQTIGACLSSMLLTSLGLTGKGVEGDTVKAHHASVAAPTNTDLLALKILYGPTIEPAESIRNVLAQQEYVQFTPTE